MQKSKILNDNIINLISRDLRSGKCAPENFIGQSIGLINFNKICRGRKFWKISKKLVEANVLSAAAYIIQSRF